MLIQNKIRLVYVLLIMCMPGLAGAQHEWQKSLPPKNLSDIEKLIGPVEQKEPSRDLNICWVWGIDEDHGEGYHEYVWVKDLYVELLRKVPRVTVTTAKLYPTKEQWEAADLVVFYLHLDFLEGPHYELMDAFLERGGGMVAIHEAMIQRPTGDAMAERFGLAWCAGESEWGVMPTPFTLTPAGKQHAVFEGFADKVEMVDEFYWKLTGDVKKIDVLATSQGGPPESSEGPPQPDELDGVEWPLFWTAEPGRGRVFASLPGHNFFTFNEPYFRIILFRSMAWAMKESFDPFKPLVTDGLDLK